MALVSEAEARALFGGSAERLEAIVERFATPRERPIKILAPLAATQGHAFEGELARWIEIFERYEMEVADPAYAELRAPGTKLTLFDFVDRRGPSWLADLLGFLCAASVIVQQDEMSFLASWASTPSGSARVYYFHPQDWGLWPTDQSIAARLFRLVEEEEREEFCDVRFSASEGQHLSSALKLFEAVASVEPLPPHLDPAKLFDRAEWLVHALLGVGRDFPSAVQRAAPLARWEEEKDAAKRWPHVATYWLWSHHFFDNRHALGEALELTGHFASQVVIESRQCIRRLRDGTRMKIADRDTAQLNTLRDTAIRAAPNEVLGAGARSRLHERLADEEIEHREAHAALAEIEATSDDDALAREALLLLEHLARGGAIAPGPAPLHGGLDADRAMDRLAEVVDERFRPLVLARLERAARVGDTHEGASWGLILAWAHLAEDVATFEAELSRIGTENFGPRRLTELFRAYGHFEEPRATQVLTEGARAWLREMDDWIRMASDEPLIQLMKRDTLQTHEVLAQLLGHASFSPANWDMCVRAAVAAGELKSKLALSGLERAVARRLGRIDDGGRASVVEAYASAAGEDGLAFLRAQMESRVADWESTDDEEDGFECVKDLACLLAGVLPLAPDDPRVIEVAAALLEQLRLKLAPQRRPRRDVIAAAVAVLTGIQRGEVRALRAAVKPFTSLEFNESASTRAVSKSLRELARAVSRELAA
ncbi:MAG: hypothetical protein RIT81_29165 [Deltaproteobacteria bacterium]